MKPEQLLVLASARGLRIDLGRPSRDVPFEHRRPPKRRYRGEKGPTDPGIPGVYTATGKQDRSHVRAQWSGADLSHAAAGMPDRFWRTLCWAIALEEQSRIWLKHELLQLALDKREQEGGWPRRFERADCMKCGMLRSEKYVEDMCVLALWEVAHPDDFSTEAARARFFGLADHAWRRHASGIYKTISAPVANWYENGLDYLRRRLRDREEVPRKKSPETA